MSPFPGPLIFAPSQRVSNGVRTGSGGSALPLILFLSWSPFPLHAAHGIMPLDPTELLAFLFLAGSLFFSFLPLYSLQSGSGSLLFFFASCQLETHVTRCHLRWRDYGPLRWPGGSLQVGNRRALVVQVHRDCWGKSGLDTSACPSFPLF